MFYLQAFLTIHQVPGSQAWTLKWEFPQQKKKRDPLFFVFSFFEETLILRLQDQQKYIKWA